VRRDLTGLFVGRREELAVLRDRLEEARSGDPGVVLIEGAPGMGKTALINRFLADAGDVRVLRAAGEQHEQLLPYGVVEQLARSGGVPLIDASTLLSQGSTLAPEPFAVGAQLVELISGLQDQGPVVVVVDDAQWADRPSLLALLFALRRFQADRVLTVIAVRDQDPVELPEGLIKLSNGERGSAVALRGLDTADLQELASGLLDEGLPAGVAKQLRDHSGGNPLHARALLEELPLDTLRKAGDTPLPCPRSFSAQVLGRLADCSPDCRRLVIAASVLGDQCPLGLAQHVASVTDVLEAVEGAVNAGLLELRDVGGEHRIAFPHSLTRAAIYHDIGPVQRAALHRRAADLIADEAAALFHRCAATVGEDDELAAELADYARRQGGRGSWAPAVAMLRASRLSSTPAEREERLLESIELLLDGGEVARAAAFTEEIRACADGPYPRYLLGRLAFDTGRPHEGEQQLLAAWEARDADSDRELSSKIATQIALVLVRRSRGPELVTWARRAMAAVAGTNLTRAPWHTLGYGLAYAGRAAEGLSELAFLPEHPRQLAPEDLGPILARGLMRYMTDDLDGARADFTALVPAAATGGPFVMRFASICFLGAVEYRLGAWDDAIAHAVLATSLCEDADQAWTLSWTHTVAAAPLAARGDWKLAQTHLDATDRYARMINDENSVADAAIVRAHIATARGEPEAVVEALAPIRRMEQREGIDEPGGRWPWQELLADALISLGRLDDAEDVLAPFEALAAARQRHSALGNAARVRGNLEAARKSPSTATAAFEAGLGHAESVSIPFDRARLHAAYGRFLRRAGKRSAAITHLKAAGEIFSRLRARPYLEDCDRELAVLGMAPAAQGEPRQIGLTPQEMSVARLVVRGLSNREVAGQLVVSVNTIEYHLKHIYAKLGITSRNQLASRLPGILPDQERRAPE
jgi:DNA-binding CsgD family transcriptional regulator